MSITVPSIFSLFFTGASLAAAPRIQLRHSEDASNSTSSSHHVADCKVNNFSLKIGAPK